MEFIDLKKQYSLHQKAIDEAIKASLNDGSFIQGPHVKAFEKSLCEFVGTKSVTCGNGTDALYLALRALNIGEGDEVIVPSFTWVSTVQVVKQVGAIPVFGDICDKTFNLDIDDVCSKITNKTKAVIPVSIFGQCAEIISFMDMSKNKDISIIEDAAQSFGALHHDKISCSIADISTTSFFPAKPLGCYGDGGAVFSNDEALLERVNILSKNGQKKRYDYHEVGINSRLDTIQAAILLEKIKIFPKEIELRNDVARHYNSQLSQIDFVTTPYIECYNKSVWAQYTLILDSKIERSDFMNHMSSKNIPVNLYYPVPLHMTQPYKDNVVLRKTEKLANAVVSLPMHPYLSQENLENICEAVKSYGN